MYLSTRTYLRELYIMNKNINLLIQKGLVITILNNFILYRDGLQFKAMKRTLSTTVKTNYKISSYKDKLIFNVLSPDKISILLFIEEDIDSLLKKVKEYKGKVI